MLFSTKAEYGVRLMVELGRQPGSQPVSLGSVAEAENLPLSYLEHLVAKLRKAGLVTSTRGADGGQAARVVAHAHLEIIRFAGPGARPVALPRLAARLRPAGAGRGRAAVDHQSPALDHSNNASVVVRASQRPGSGGGLAGAR